MSERKSMTLTSALEECLLCIATDAYGKKSQYERKRNSARRLPGGMRETAFYTDIVTRITRCQPSQWSSLYQYMSRVALSTRKCYLHETDP
eukprot:5289030-Amphidinium_carterae.1